MKNINLIFILCFCILLSSESLPQESLSIGGYIGGGVISGNTAERGSFSSSIFFEADPGIYQDLSLRLSFLYHTDFNSVLPNTTKKYYPFLRGLGLKAITFQRIGQNLFIEEGLGLIAINDRTLSGINQWDYGVNFSLAAGFDFRDIENKGFKISLGAEYGLTFFKTLPTYFSTYLQVQYFFF